MAKHACMIKIAQRESDVKSPATESAARPPQTPPSARRSAAPSWRQQAARETDARRKAEQARQINAARNEQAQYQVAQQGHADRVERDRADAQANMDYWRGQAADARARHEAEQAYRAAVHAAAPTTPEAVDARRRELIAQAQAIESVRQLGLPLEAAADMLQRPRPAPLVATRRPIYVPESEWAPTPAILRAGGSWLVQMLAEAHDHLVPPPVTITVAATMQPGTSSVATWRARIEHEGQGVVSELSGEVHLGGADVAILQAVVAGLQAMEGDERVTIRTDSIYLLSAAPHLGDWRAAGWHQVTRKGKLVWPRHGLVPHADLWQAIDQAARGRKIKWEAGDVSSVSAAPAQADAPPSAPGETVRIYPTLTSQLMRSHSPGLCLWYLAHYLNESGSGRLEMSALRAAAMARGWGADRWGDARRDAHRAGFVAIRRDRQGREYVILRGPARIASDYGISGVGRCFVDMPLAALDDADAFKCHAWGAFLAGGMVRRGELTARRELLAEISGVPTRTQLEYEKRLGVIVRQNYLDTGLAAKAGVLEGLRDIGQPVFAYTDRKSGRKIIMRCLPNAYYVPTMSRGQVGRIKKINGDVGWSRESSGAGRNDYPQRIFFGDVRAAKAASRRKTNDLSGFRVVRTGRTTRAGIVVTEYRDSGASVLRP